MPELRQETLTGRWVIMAADRQGRPNEFTLAPPPVTDPGVCPFCPGHEDRTTPEILATGREPGDPTSRWRVRVFGNMYPALVPEPARLQPAGGLFPCREARGGHEVVAYTPDHQGSLGRLEPGHLAEVLMVVRDRARALTAGVPGVNHVLPFCNHGPQAGATLAHPHLQILASPLIPALVREKARRLAAHRREHGSCLLCDTVAAEEEKKVRVIAGNDQWLLVAPWASSFPYEMRAIPRRHAGRFEDAGDEELALLAPLLKSALASLEQIHQNPSYNVIIHGGASAGDGSPGAPEAAGPDFHWHLEVLPRLTRLAGFEAGSGFAINTVAPEASAARLRGEG